MRRTVLLRALALVSLGAATACDLLTGNKEGSYTLSLSDAVLTLGQSRTDTVLVSVTRKDFSKPVTLTISGVPVGVSASLLPSNVIQSGATSAQLTLTAAATAAPATSTVSVKATAEGQPDQTSTFDLTVSVTGTFSLSSHGFPATAAQGGGAIGTVLITRAGGHADNVTLSVSGAPSGTSTSLSPTATTAGAAALTITADPNVSAGVYALTVTGSAPGLSNQTTPVIVNVVTPPATSTLTVPFCAGQAPAWFAYQNDGYLWQSPLPTGNAYVFPATAKLATAYVIVGAGRSDLYVISATRPEFAAQSDRDCPGPKSLNGSVSGATTGQSTRIVMGAAFTTPTFANPSYTLSGVADRALDLVATKGTITSDQTNLQVTPDALIIRRNQNPPSGTTLSALDFANEGFAPVATNLTLANVLAGDQLNIANTLWTATTTYGIVHNIQPSTASNTLFSIPAARMIAGDLQEMFLETYQPGFSSGRITATYVSGAIGDRTVTLPPAASSPTVSTLATTSHVRLRGQLPVQAEYPTASRFVFCQGCSTSSLRLVIVIVTSGSLGGVPASAWDVVIPEFGLVSGLNPSWLLSTSSVVYQAEAWSGPAGDWFGAIPAAGDVQSLAYRIGSTGTLLAAQRAPTALARARLQYFRR